MCLFVSVGFRQVWEVLWINYLNTLSGPACFCSSLTSKAWILAFLLYSHKYLRTFSFHLFSFCFTDWTISVVLSSILWLFPFSPPSYFVPLRNFLSWIFYFLILKLPFFFSYSFCFCVETFSFLKVCCKHVCTWSLHHFTMAALKTPLSSNSDISVISALASIDLFLFSLISLTLGLTNNFLS